MEVIGQLIELFPYAILGSVVAGMICAFLGIFVTSQRVVFLGAVLTQTSIAGVAFSFLHFVNLEELLSSLTGIVISEESIFHDLEPVFFSLLFALITVLIFSQTYKQKLLSQDTILGIIFVISVALRIMFIQKSASAEMSEIESIMKGDILFIGKSEFVSMLIILTVILFLFTLFSKQLRFVVFDPESASAHGLNSHFWLLFFYLLVGIGISLTTRFVGDVFAFAYLIIPSSIGLLLGKRVFHVFLIAVAAGAVIPPVSLYLAFRFDYSSGPMAVAAAFALLALSYGYKKFIN